jgi:hypothetical protein
MIRTRMYDWGIESEGLSRWNPQVSIKRQS